MPAMRQYGELSHKMQLFVKVLRSNLLASDKVAVTLAEEMEVVKDFVSLREQTNPVTPHVSWHVDEAVDTGILVPTMCIQIPVENALKYAFDGMEGSGEITVSVRQGQGSACEHPRQRMRIQSRRAQQLGTRHGKRSEDALPHGGDAQCEKHREDAVRHTQPFGCGRAWHSRHNIHTL